MEYETSEGIKKAIKKIGEYEESGKKKKEEKQNEKEKHNDEIVKLGKLLNPIFEQLGKEKEDITSLVIWHNKFTSKFGIEFQPEKGRHSQIDFEPDYGTGKLMLRVKYKKQNGKEDRDVCHTDFKVFTEGWLNKFFDEIFDSMDE